MKADKKVSIVTVCLNADKEIVKTLESVLNLEFQDYEYIIKDGCSTDYTKEIILAYQKKFEKKNINFQFIEKQDKGIYDAMNQSLDYCRGEWINFMNAGDSFFRDDVLKDIFDGKDYTKEQLLYGSTLLEMSHGYKLVQLNHLEKLCRGVGISQQVCFFKRELLKQKKFSTAYKLLSDYAFLLMMYDKKLPYKSLNLIVASYNRQGLSAKEIYRVNLEKEDILKRAGYLHKGSSRLVKWTWHIKAIIAKRAPIIQDIVLCFRGGGYKEII